MGKNRPGVRDGSGPASGSYQQKTVGKGKRVAAGKPCPKKKKKK